MDIIFAGRLTELDGGVFALLAARVAREKERESKRVREQQGGKGGEGDVESLQGNNRCELLTGAAVRALLTPTSEINRPAAIASEKGQVRERVGGREGGRARVRTFRKIDINRGYLYFRARVTPSPDIIARHRFHARQIYLCNLLRIILRFSRAINKISHHCDNEEYSKECSPFKRI